MDKRITDLLTLMERTTHADSMSVQMTNMAKVLAILAEEQAQATDTMKKQTRTLVYLTWAITALTSALLVYTIMLYQDTCTNKQDKNFTTHHVTKQP